MLYLIREHSGQIELKYIIFMTEFFSDALHKTSLICFVIVVKNVS